MKASEVESLICRKVDEIIASHGHAYVGFDIFDTLISRIVPKEVELSFKCRRLAALLSGSHSRHEEVFAAYERAYHASCQRNDSSGLDYEVFTSDLFRVWSSELTRLGLFIEEDQLYSEILASETAISVAIPYAKRLLDRLSKKNATLFFLSDMYMGKRIVEPLLEHHGLNRYFEFGYVSSDLGLLKRTGSLFKYVLAERDLRPEQIIFVGDDQNADVVEPQKLGLHSVHYHVDGVEAERADLRAQFARAGSDPAHLPAAIYRALCGFKFQHQSIEDISVSKYLGPFFANFAQRIEETIADVAADHVLFAAREGLFLRKLVEGLRSATAVSSPPREAILHYFPSSRLTSLQFGLSKRGIGLRELAGAVSNGGATLRGLLSFMLPSEAELKTISADAGLSGPDEWLPSPIWEWSPFHRIIDSINASDALMRVRKQGERFEAFMIQQGILDGSTKLLVDLGWSGQIQENLAIGLAQRGYSDRLVGLYAGTTLKAHWKVTPRNIVRWHFADVDNRSALPHPILWYPQILENLCRSPHGTCIGFEVGDKGIVRPEVKTRRDPQEERDDLLISRMQMSILRYAASYGVLCEAYGLSAASFRDLVVQLMFKFLVFPDKEVARLFSGISNVSDFGSDEIRRSAGMDGTVGVDDDAVEHIAAQSLWPQAVTAASLGSRAALRRAMTIERHRWPAPDRPFAPGMTLYNHLALELDFCRDASSQRSEPTEAYKHYETWVSEIWDQVAANGKLYSGMEFRFKEADLPPHFLSPSEFLDIQEIDRQICSRRFFDNAPLPAVADHPAMTAASGRSHSPIISALAALHWYRNRRRRRQA